MKRTAVLGMLTMVVLTGVAGAPNASATLPARSGELVYSFSNPHGKVINGDSGVDAFGTRMKVRGSVFRCSYFFISVGSCFTFDAAATADSEGVGIVVAEVVEPSPTLRYRLALVGPLTAERSAWSPGTERRARTGPRMATSPTSRTATSGSSGWVRHRGGSRLAAGPLHPGLPAVARWPSCAATGSGRCARMAAARTRSFAPRDT